MFDHGDTDLKKINNRQTCLFFSLFFTIYLSIMTTADRVPSPPFRAICALCMLYGTYAHESKVRRLNIILAENIFFSKSENIY